MSDVIPALVDRPKTIDTKPLSVFSRIPLGLGARMGGSPLLWNLFIFGLPVWILFNINFLLRAAKMDGADWLLASVYLASLWIWIAPLLVYAWEQRFRRYREELRERSVIEGWDESIVTEACDRADRWRELFGIGFALLSVAAQIAALPVLDQYLGTHGWSDPVQWSSLVVTGFMCYASGIGLWGVIKGILVTSAVAKSDLDWLPLHPDDLGSYGFIGDFSLYTTALFSVGCLVVPATIEIAAFIDGLGKYVVGSTAGVFSLAVAASFFIPTVSISRLARRKKDGYIRRIGEEVQKRASVIMGQSRQGDHVAAEVEALLAYYERVKAATTYPFGVAATAKLGLSIAAPIALFFLEYFLGRVVK